MWEEAMKPQMRVSWPMDKQGYCLCIYCNRRVRDNCCDVRRREVERVQRGKWLARGGGRVSGARRWRIERLYYTRCAP